LARQKPVQLALGFEGDRGGVLVLVLGKVDEDGLGLCTAGGKKKKTTKR